MLQLIAESFMSEDRKEYWRNALPTMSRAQVGELVKMLLDERDSMTEEDARTIVQEVAEAEKRMWKVAEEITKRKEEQNVNKMLADL